MSSKQRITQIVQFINSIRNKKDCLTFFFIIGGLIYFLNNAFCIFYEKMPRGKMNDEGVMLVHKVDDVLIKHNYCKDYYGCVARQMVFFKETCSDIKFDFYSGIYMDETVKSEIIAEIAKFSTYQIHVSFYDETFEPGFFFTSFPTTDLYIERKKP